MKVWVGAVIIAVLTSLAVLSSVRVQRKALTLQVVTKAYAEYRVHWIIVLAMWIDIFMSLWILLEAGGQGLGVTCFYLAVGIPLFALGVAGLYSCHRAKVVFSGGQFVFCDGLRTHTCNLSEVKDVWAANGLITVDFGQIPRIVILHVFSNSADILARLQGTALNNRMEKKSRGGGVSP
jgi:hypothetical protein